MSFLKLTLEEKKKFGAIVYNTQNREHQLIDDLGEQDLQLLRNIYAQKIAYQAINGKIQQFVYGQPIYPLKQPQIPNLWESLFCICYPVNHQQFFDITTEVFLQRCFYPFFFWNNGFLRIHDNLIEYYGFTWMLLTYSILLGLSSNLSNYFVKPTNFQVNYWRYVECIGLVFITKTIQVIGFSSAIGCLGGRVLIFQVMMAQGYSLVLYFFPTLLCLAPSLYWHVLMLSLAAILRGIFLSRTFASKIQSRYYIIYVSVFLCQVIYLFLVARIMFGDDSGYTFHQGFISVISPQPALENDDSSSHQTAVNITNNISHLFTYIPFHLDQLIYQIPNQTLHLNKSVQHSFLRAYDM